MGPTVATAFCKSASLPLGTSVHEESGSHVGGVEDALAVHGGVGVGGLGVDALVDDGVVEGVVHVFVLAEHEGGVAGVVQLVVGVDQLSVVLPNLLASLLRRRVRVLLVVLFLKMFPVPFVIRFSNC